MTAATGWQERPGLAGRSGHAGLLVSREVMARMEATARTELASLALRGLAGLLDLRALTLRCPGLLAPQVQQGVSALLGHRALTLKCRGLPVLSDLLDLSGQQALTVRYRGRPGLRDPRGRPGLPVACSAPLDSVPAN